MSTKRFRHKIFFSAVSLSVSALCSISEFYPQSAWAALYPGWKTVGSHATHVPKFVFDVPPDFQVDATVKNRLPNQHSNQPIWEEMSAAAMGTHCPNWPRSLAFLESLDEHEPVSFPAGQAMIDYARAVMKKQLSIANINTGISVSPIGNFDAHGHQGKRVDLAAYYDANRQACNAHLSKLTVVEIGGKTRFVFFRDQDVTGALPEHTADNLIKTLRQI